MAMLMKTSTKWMVDVINLSNSARQNNCHKKSEQGLVLSGEVNNLLSEFLFLQILVIYVVVFQSMDKK